MWVSRDSWAFFIIFCIFIDQSMGNKYCAYKLTTKTISLTSSSIYLASMHHMNTTCMVTESHPVISSVGCSEPGAGPPTVRKSQNLHPKSLWRFLFVRLNQILFQELHPNPFLLVMKTLQKPVNVVWGQEETRCTVAWNSRIIQWSLAFFSKGGCDSQQADGLFHVFLFFSAFSCGLASTVMCPIIPLYKRFFKSSEGSLGAVCFYISANLVPLNVNWRTCLICFAIVNTLKCFLVCVGVVSKKCGMCLYHRGEKGYQM